MPIYEYACAACDLKFEEWQKMSDAPVRTCPRCKKRKVERLISATAFQLKGGGWYADLYSSPSNKPADKSSGAADSTSSSSTTESKPTGETKASTASTTEATKPSGTTPVA